MDSDKPLVGIVMGSDSDWPQVKKACDTLDRFGVGYETRVISAHRTPDVALEYSKSAESRGLKVIIAAAGGVAANSIIRGDLERACAEQSCKLYLPPLRLCGDNGAMIGAQGYYEYLAGHTAGMELNAYATRDIAD